MQIGEIKFDHGSSASRSRDVSGRPVLIQNGTIFTNAEMNRFNGKYEPEPVPIAPEEPYKELLMPKVLTLIEQIQNLNQIIGELIEPIKMVLASETVIKTPPRTNFINREEVEPITDEKEFKRLNKVNFQSWVDKNKNRIALLEPEDEILDAIIEKWEGFFPNEALII